MVTRERFMNVLHYRDVDRLPALHFGYWQEVLDQWAEQGHITKEIAAGARYNGSEAQQKLDQLLGWDCICLTLVGPNFGLYPRFETKVLETLPDGSQRVLNENGVIDRIKPGVVSIPAEDDYLLKDRASFEEWYRWRMQYSHDRVNFRRNRGYLC